MRGGVCDDRGDVRACYHTPRQVVLGNGESHVVEDMVACAAIGSAAIGCSRTRCFSCAVDGQLVRAPRAVGLAVAAHTRDGSEAYVSPSTGPVLHQAVAACAHLLACVAQTPPRSLSISSTTSSRPSFAKAQAIVTPATPPPTITASVRAGGARTSDMQPRLQPFPSLSATDDVSLLPPHGE